MAAVQPGRPFDPKTGRSPRTLVLCFDGTNSQFDETNTNVPKFFALLERDLPGEQLLYYQTGIGTYTSPALLGPVTQAIAKLADMAVAWYLDEHIKDGYKFLMGTYCPGDRIAIFGFSRGAYVGRALAGMLMRVGLLTFGAVEQVDFAYKMYKRTDAAGAKLAESFKATFSQPVTVDFVGCWDTVASVGVIMGRSLPFVTDNSSIIRYRQALSIDERRVRYPPLLFNNGFPPSVEAPSDNAGTKSPVQAPAEGPLPEEKRQLEQRLGKDTESVTEKALADEGSKVAGKSWASKQRRYRTDVEEVWFSGFHSDVGGGNLKNSENVGLDRLTLAWMVREVIAADVGIIFSADALRASNLSVNPSSIPPDPSPTPVSPLPEGDSRNAVGGSPKPAEIPPATDGTSGTTGQDGGFGNGTKGLQTAPTQLTGNDFEKNATAKAHDALGILGVQALWWILEVLPVPRSRYELDNEGKQVKKTSWVPNLGRGRKLPKGAKLHTAVKFRMDSVKGYKPKGKIPSDAVYVD